MPTSDVADIVYFSISPTAYQITAEDDVLPAELIPVIQAQAQNYLDSLDDGDNSKIESTLLELLAITLGEDKNAGVPTVTLEQVALAFIEVYNKGNIDPSTLRVDLLTAVKNMQLKAPQD